MFQDRVTLDTSSIEPTLATDRAAGGLTSPKLTQLDRLDLQSIIRLEQHLPTAYEPYTDVYFLRAKEILAAEGMNPWVRGQVMIRKGPGIVGGINEAIAIIDKYSDFFKHGGTVRALQDGDTYEAGDTVLMFEGPLLDVVALETMYLGVLSAATTEATDGIDEIDLQAASSVMQKTVEAAEGRPVIYFGARHWSYKSDRAIASAAIDGGAVGASTLVGAQIASKDPSGTIPHVLENAFAALSGSAHAVRDATLAFDRVINPAVPRIALIDYNNREIDDSIETAVALDGRLYGVRVDTCGENVAQGALLSASDPEAQKWRARGIYLPDDSDADAKYWYGHGVTVTGVYALRIALDQAGFKDVKIILSSGFADAAKVAAFVKPEMKLGVRLFDSLGVGGIYKSRSAKMDIVGVRDEEGRFIPLSKAGRHYKDNPKLKNVTLHSVQ